MNRKGIKYTTRNGKFGTEVYVKDPKMGGYTGYFNDFPGMVTEGKTIKDVQTRLWNVAYDTMSFLLNNMKKKNG